MKEKNPRTLFPTPVLRLMTVAVVGTVSVQPVTSRNSAIAAVPAKNFLTKKTPVDVTKARIATNSTTGDADMIDRQHLLFFINLFCVLSGRSW